MKDLHGCAQQRIVVRICEPGARKMKHHDVSRNYLMRSHLAIKPARPQKFSRELQTVISEMC
jgi:hypothetical protein